jgi:magnesium chelatase subunit D
MNTLALSLFAIDPAGLGGLLVRGRAGPARDELLACVRAMMADAPVRRLPVSISDDRLLGGLDLAATLALGKPVALRGVLADCDGGLLIAPMAERIGAGLASKLAAVMDRGEVATERDGMSLNAPASFGLIALDEGVEDERVSVALSERLAFHLDCDKQSEDAGEIAGADEIANARALLRDVEIPHSIIVDLVEAADAFGIDSLRAVQHAARAAKIAAAFAGRLQVNADDAKLAAQLVLGPRARRLPPQQQEEPEPQQEPQDEDEQPSDENPACDGQKDNPQDSVEQTSADPGADTMTEAVRASLPANLLAQLLGGELASKRGGAGGKSGAARQSKHRGRPTGSRPGDPRSGARLALLDTLRAAAPLQKLRRAALRAHSSAKILVRREDFRIVRFAERRRTTTIFVVDASGSSALHRLAEAKGAVQHLLSECYVRRDEAALIAFRGKGAEILLPPTRSLTRVRRSLRRLPGGGGTPLAAGLAMAADLARQVAHKGDVPVLVFLTDGQANVALDGKGERASADLDASNAAKALRASGFASLVIDTSPRPQPRAQKLALDLGARYLPLPTANPALMSRAVQQAAR